MVWRRFQRMVCDNFCKLLQRQTYTFLSSRHGMFLCFTALLLGFLSVVQFGEVALEWSVARYRRTLFPYNDNILHKSYQHRLCLPVPIDIVYTWVNGTDPRLLKELTKLKNEIEETLNASSIETNYEKTLSVTSSVNKANSVSRKDGTETRSKEGCPYENCVPLNSLVLKLHNEARLADLKSVDSVFRSAVRVSNVSMKSSSRPGSRKSTLTIVKFSSEYSVKLAANRAFTINGEQVIAQRAYLTSQSVELAVRMRAVAIVSIKQKQTDENAFKRFLYLHFTEKIKELDYYKKENVAILTFKDDQGYNEAISLRKGELTFQKLPLLIEPAMMVWEPFPGNPANANRDNHFSASRFADNQELRYSLRSVEKHAPWVRTIFIVTNGQIPSWLNLDNPRIKIITHSEIFRNQSHLPTFSSPAIESHLHKIPGLSKKFIYLNDDVMFGRDVWPDDFFTHAKGQKVFLSWPVPNCNEGCPSTWINDKYCDKACNVSDCDWDGGDCIGKIHNAQKWQSVISNLKNAKIHDFCNSGCADTWIGDKYCDSACNNPMCGLDAGDCGVERFSMLYSVTLHKNTKMVHLPKGLHAMYFNLSEVFGRGQITEGEQDGSPILRSVTIAQKFKVMTLTFYPNLTLTTINFRLAGLVSLNDTTKLEIKFNVTIETTSDLKKEVAKIDKKNTEKVLSTAENVLSTPENVQHVQTTLYPIRIYNANRTMNYWNAGVNETVPFPTWKQVDQSEYCVPKVPDDMTVPEDVLKIIEELKEDLKAGDITDKGFKRKTAKVFKQRLGISCNSKFHPTTVHSEMRHMKSIMANKDNVERVTTDLNPLPKKRMDPATYSTRHLTSFKQMDSEWSFLPWERQGTFRLIQELKEKQSLRESYMTAKFSRRVLLDAFSGSLLHVNKIYNRAFGYKARKVPSHMPHMIDVGVMEELQAKFPEEFDKTSSHKLRSPDDMQFALSYFYYVIDQTNEFNISQVFEEVDVDKSGTLSDRELRTLLTTFEKLPLGQGTIEKFIKALRNCSSAQENQLARPRPNTDQQYGFDLPLITETVLRNCESIMNQLNDSKKKESKFKHEVVGEEDITFKMIKNNATHVMLQLDDVRKTRKKFICLNDNIDHDKENSSKVKRILVDFYESLFPVPSQFELPRNLRNRFLYVDEMMAWRKSERTLEFASESMLVVFVVVLFVYIFWHQLRHLIRRIVTFFSRRFRPARFSNGSSTRLLTV